VIAADRLVPPADEAMPLVPMAFGLEAFGRAR
jgi:hypothetical protein